MNRKICEKCLGIRDFKMNMFHCGDGNLFMVWFFSPKGHLSQKCFLRYQGQVELDRHTAHKLACMFDCDQNLDRFAPCEDCFFRLEHILEEWNSRPDACHFNEGELK